MVRSSSNPPGKKKKKRSAPRPRAAAKSQVTSKPTSRAIEPTDTTVAEFKFMLESCRQAVVVAGADRRIRVWNRAATELFGYSPDQAIGMPVERLIPEKLQADFQKAFDRFSRSRTQRKVRDLKTYARRADGTELCVEISLAMGRMNGAPLFFASIRDYSEQQAHDDRLNEALQLLRFHTERMPLAYIVWDCDFRAVEWNRAAERMFGFSAEEAIGRHALELIVPPDARKKVSQVWADLLQGDLSSHSVNSNIRKDGSRLMCEWFNTPLRAANGAIRGVASMAMNVSEREEKESQIRTMQKLESLGVLAGGVAHDFNSALTVIMGNTTLLRSTQTLNQRGQELLGLIEDAALRAGNLIRHLLAYARTGRHNPQSVNLNAILRDVLKFVSASIGKAHTLELHLAQTLPPIMADTSQVEQVVLNLCMNAMQASPPGSVIHVSTRDVTLSDEEIARCIPHDVSAGRHVELEVRDSGCGMDEATLSRMFDPFFSTKPDGHGLGMAAVLGILRQHGAAARAESALQRGTTVHIYFPVQRTVSRKR